MVEPMPEVGIDQTAYIVLSPDGTKWKLKVDNDGVLDTEEVT